MLEKIPDFTDAEMAGFKAKGERLRANTASATCGWVVRHTDSLMKAIAEHIHDLREAVEELEAKTALLEEKSLRYQGTHDKAAQYGPGDCVTAKGGMWHCKTITRSLPGTNGDWQLMHKTPTAARRNRT